jgi:hypothetical protein
MKRLLVALALVLMVAGLAFAGSKVRPLDGRTAPKPTKTVCKSITAGKAGSASFDVSGTSMVNWNAITSATNTTAVIVKRKLNANTVGIAYSNERDLPVAAETTAIVFGKYSAADNSVTPVVCMDLN